MSGGDGAGDFLPSQESFPTFMPNFNLPFPHPVQVIPQGVAPTPCVPCCLVLTDKKAFTCHEDCQTSFFRSLGTVELTDITAISTEAGKEYCILVSVVLWGQTAQGWAKTAVVTLSPSLDV